MIQCQRLFLLAVLATSCFVSFLRADTFNAFNVNIEDGKISKNHQRELPQLEKPEPNIASVRNVPSGGSTISGDEISRNLVLIKDAIRRFAGKKDSVLMDRLIRGIQLLVEKKDTDKEVKHDSHWPPQGHVVKRNNKYIPQPPYLSAQEFIRSFKRQNPYFIGKRSFERDEDLEEKNAAFGERNTLSIDDDSI